MDNFTTPGIAIGGVQSLPTLSATVFNLATLVGSDLGINSGISGRLSFRLYAWGATSGGGRLVVHSQPSWSISPAVANPGIRMTGTIEPPAFPISIDSDIVTETSVVPGQNIDYTLYATPSGLTFFNSIPLGGFTIRDGGASSPDSDSEPTVLEAIEFAVSNSENIAALAILTSRPSASFHSRVCG